MKKLKKMLFVLVAVAMVVPSPVYAINLENSNEFKIASYNLAAKGGKTTEIGQLLASKNIDIAGLQEVDYMNSRNNKDMLKEIATAASDEDRTYDYFFHKSIDYAGGEYGNGIIAKGTLSNKSGAAIDTNDYEGRCYQRAEVTINGKKVAVYNTHLTWEDKSLRASQIETVLNVMNNDSTEYKVLTGDFNAQESNDEFDVFLRDYHIANGQDKWFDTYIPSDATMQTNAIDNIITTRNIEIKSVETVEATDIGSDHRALIATCEFLDEEQVSTQLLDKRIAKAKELLKANNIYTEESLNALSKAIVEAENADTTKQTSINTAINALNKAIDSLEVLPSTPVAHWDFDGEDPLRDKTGRGNDGKAVNTISYEAGLDSLGNALRTNGGYVSVAKVTDDLDIGKSDFSVGFWYKASNPSAWVAVLGNKDWGSGGNLGMDIVYGQGQFYTSYAAIQNQQQENIVSGTGKKVYDGKWHYITAVLDRDDRNLLYVDGSLIAEKSIASTDGIDVKTNFPFNIGADGAGNYGMDSLIDDVKVYKNALTPAEIQEEYLKYCDKSQVNYDALVQKTQDALKDMVIDPTTTTEMPIFKTDDGKYISHLFCSENDITINDEGKILRQPLVDKKVQVTYIIQENREDVAYDEGTMVKNKWVTVKGEKTNNVGSNEMPEVVPTLQEWHGATGSFSINGNTKIIVPSEYYSTLVSAANITRNDIKELFGIDTKVVQASVDTANAGDIVLTLGNGDEKLGEQGYALEIGTHVVIRGTAYRGVFFGTRSLLQGMLTSGNKTIACGKAVDYPNYEIREFMLDLGRKYFPMWSLKDMMKYASWFKLTDFQAHISEDTFNDYSAFRLESDIPHLTSTDGYYTKEEYREFQKYAQTYGIRVITEIDGPAHARRFIELGNYEDAPDKYKNLGLDGTHFNLSEKDGARTRVLNLMDEVLEEYLGGDDPVIITDAFNVGMDEYFGNQDDLRAYAVHVYDKIVNKYGKTAFGWDSNASLPNETYTKDQYPIDNIVINFWKWEEVSGGMKSLMDQGYKVVNGDHRWYIVPGAQIGFYDYVNQEKLYKELSAGNMVGWYGNGTIFPEGHPNIAGGNMLIWNDRGMFAGYTVNDIFARQRSQYPILAQTYWYGREDGESYNEFKEKVDKVGVGPGLNNLYKDIDSDGEVVYSFDMESLNNHTITDNSSNGYDATVTNGTLTDGHDGKQLTFNGDGYIEAKHDALKWPYTVTFDLKIDEEQTNDIVLFEQIMPEQECVKKDNNKTGQESSSIVLKEQDDGTYAFTYSREGFTFEHNYKFKKGQAYRIAFSSDESKITGGEYSKWNQPTKLYVNGELVSTLQGPEKPADFTGSSWWIDSPSINLPLEKIGQNLVGSIDNFNLYNRLLSDAEIKALGGIENQEPEQAPINLALNKSATASSIKGDSFVAENATDGDMSTRWGSNYNGSTNDPFDKVEWLTIDLEKSYSLDTVKLHWQDAYAKQYKIQLSEDGKIFTDVLTITDGDGKEDVLDLAGAKGRYLRIYCTEAVPSNDSWKWNYGYSLFEVEAYEKTYTVTFNVEGNESTKTIKSSVGKLGDKMPDNPIKEGYVFKEWNTKADGTGSAFNGNSEVNEDITVYAIFTLDNLALNKPTSASSYKNDSLSPKYATDGIINSDSRWASNYNSSTNEPFDKEEWLLIDLKDSYPLGTMKLHWEDAYAKKYIIQVSEDGETFTDVLTITDGDGKEDVLDLGGTRGRYLRIYCHEAVPSNDSWKWNYGYSLIEVEVYKANEYQVIFNVDDDEKILIVSEDSGKLGEMMPASPTKEGFVFREWNTKADGTGKTITADSPINGKMTVYAIFEVDKTKLKDVIALANDKLENKNYTDDSLEALNKELNNAKSVMNNVNATKAEVEAIIEALQNKIDALQLKLADYSKISILIATIKSLNKDIYKDFSAVEKAIGDVIEGLDITKQKEVNAMAKAIEDAMIKLELKEADYSKVNEAIKKANALNKDEYKDFSKVEEAVNAIVRDLKITEQEKVDAMAKNIEDAIAKLEKKPVKVMVDKTKLEKAVKDAKDIDTSIYTKESIEVLKETIQNAENVLKNENATEKDVNDAQEKLQSALDKLVLIDNDQPSVPEKPTETKPQQPAIDTDEIDSNVLGDMVDTTHPTQSAKTNDVTMILPYVILGLCALGTYIYIKKEELS